MTNLNDPPCRGSILGHASAYQLIDQPEQRARTIRALAHIARQRLEVEEGNKTVTDAADEIRTVLNTEGPLDPDTFGVLYKSLTPSDKEDEAMLGALKSGIGADFTVGSVLVDMASEGAALAVTGVGILADWAITAFGPAWLKTANPPPNDDDVFSLTAWATKKLVDLSSMYPKALDLASALHQSGDLQVDVSRSVTDAVKDLPEGAQKALAPVINSGGNPPVDSAETEAKFRSEITSAIANLNKKVDEALDSQIQEANAAVQAAKAQKIKQEVEEIAQDINSVGVIADLVFSKLFEQPDTGRKIAGVAQAAGTIFVALATPGLGPLAIAGALAGAALNLSNIFGGQGDDLLKSLGVVQQKLDQVIQVLGVIEQQQVDILKMLGQIYAAELRIQDELQTVRVKVDALLTFTKEEAVADARKKFDDSLSQQAKDLANKSANQVANDAASLESYRKYNTDFYTFAYKTSRIGALANNHEGTLASEGWLEAIRVNPRCNRLIGLLPPVAALLNIDLQKRNEPLIDLPVPDATKLAEPLSPTAGPVCPTIWAEGVQNYLQSRIWGAIIDSNPGETTELQNLWRAGSYIRELIIRMTSPDVLGLVGRKWRESAGVLQSGSSMNKFALSANMLLIGDIYRAAAFYDEKNARSYSITEYSNAKYVSAWTKNQNPDYANAPHMGLEFIPDFFQILSEKNLVDKLGPVNPDPNNRNLYPITVVVRAPGKPFDNSPLVPEAVGFSNAFAIIVYPFRGRPAGDWILFDPHLLQNESLKWFLGLVSRATTLTEIPAVLAQKVLPSSYTEFEFWGEVLRTLAAFIRWRSATDSTQENVLLQDRTGPFSIAELQAVLKQELPARLSFNGEWPLEVAMIADALLVELIEDLRKQAAIVSPDKSVPTIDATLRDLTGYMLARGIKIPNPSLGTGRRMKI
jgi:hypothetical protein